MIALPVHAPMFGMLITRWSSRYIFMYLPSAWMRTLNGRDIHDFSPLPSWPANILFSSNSVRGSSDAFLPAAVPASTSVPEMPMHWRIEHADVFLLPG